MSSLTIPNETSTRRLHFTPLLAVLILIHLGLGLSIAGFGWSAPIVAFATSLSQLGLISIWAATITKNSILKFAAPLLGICFCWFQISRVLPWGRGEPASAGWALALLVQVVTVFLVIGGNHLLARIKRYAQTESENDSDSALTMNIQTMILWTTAIACVFGGIRFCQYYWQWRIDFLQWEFMRVMPIIGFTNGLVAVLWLWSTCHRRSSLGIVARIAIAIFSTVVLACIECFLVTLIAATPAINLWVSILILGSQSFLIAISLAIANNSFDSGAGLESHSHRSVQTSAAS